MKAGFITGLGILFTLAACAGSSGGEWDLNFSIKDVTLGETVYGKPLTPQDLEYHVVLLEFWGMACPPCVASLPTLSKWYEEYKSQGLVVIGVHCQRGSNDALRSFVKQRGVTYTICADGNIRGAHFRGIPHCFLFDSTGKCIYRGSPFNALPALKEAVAKAPFAALGERELVKLKSISDALKRGMPPAKALKKALGLVSSEDEGMAEEAKFVVDSLTKWGEGLIENAKAKKDTDPAGCLAALHGIAKGFVGTEIGRAASEELADLKDDEAFQTELKASRMLEKIKALEKKIKTTGPDEDTTSDTFRKRNYAVLKSIRAGVKALKKKYPDTRAAAEAGAIAGKYGLN